MASEEHAGADEAESSDEVEEPDLSGTTLDGRYHLLHRLGVGGMGVVYAAHHLKLRTRVAVKLLKRQYSSPHAKHRMRFLREAQAAARVQDPNVVQIMDFGETEDDIVYFVMELVEGRDLGEFLEASGPLPWLRARAIALQVASALAAAHSHGIIHRDVKPSNCILYDDERHDAKDVVKVLDFGIAKLDFAGGKATQALTGTDELFGTVAYMAPELVEGVPASPASDVYALGVMLFQMLTGRLPFEGPTPLKVLTLHMTEAPPRLGELEPSIPAEVEAVVLRCLEKDPGDRFAGMDEIAAALRAARNEPNARQPMTTTLVLPGAEQARSAAAVTARAVVQRPPVELSGREQAPLPADDAGRNRRPIRVAPLALTLVAISALGVVAWQVGPTARSVDAFENADDGSDGSAAVVEVVDAEARLERGAERLAAPDAGVRAEEVETEPGEVRSDARSPEPTSSSETGAPGSTSSDDGSDSRASDGNPSAGSSASERGKPSPTSIVRRRVKQECPLDASRGRIARVTGPVGSDGYYIVVRVTGVDSALASCITRIVKAQSFPRSKGELSELELQIPR